MGKLQPKDNKEKKVKVSQSELDSLQSNVLAVVKQGWKDLKANEASVFDIRLGIAHQLAIIKALKGSEFTKLKKAHAFGATSLTSLNADSTENFEKNYIGISYNFLNACFKLSKWVDAGTGKLKETELIEASLSSNTISNMTGSRHMGKQLGVEAVTKKEALKIKGTPSTRVKEVKNPSALLIEHISLVMNIMNRTEKLQGEVTEEQLLSIKQAISYIHQTVSKHKAVEGLEKFLLQNVTTLNSK